MSLNLSDPIFTDERKSRSYFEAIRWPDGVVCPHCGNADQARLYPIKANVMHKVREGLRECQDCHGQFTVMTGSVMESSHLPLTKWALAYRLMASAKKGISAHQMHRTLGVSYKTAWFLCHRIHPGESEIWNHPDAEGRIRRVSQNRPRPRKSHQRCKCEISLGDGAASFGRRER